MPNTMRDRWNAIQAARTAPKPLRRFTLTVLHVPPVYLIDLGLDHCRHRTVEIMARSKDDALNRIAAGEGREVSSTPFDAMPTA